MLRKTRNLKGCRLGAQDGEIGHVKDLHFDDHTWTVRYLVTDTGRWLPKQELRFPRGTLADPQHLENRLTPHMGHEMFSGRKVSL